MHSGGIVGLPETNEDHERWEVSTAKSIHDLVTWQSITWRRFFPDFEMLDAKIASALFSSALPKESQCRRAMCSEIRPILTRNADC